MTDKEDELILTDPLDLSDPEIIERIKKLELEGKYHRREPKSIKGYLPFPTPITARPYDEWVIEAYPQLLFRPNALMCWDYDSGSIINLITIGNQVQGAVAPGELPISFFGTARTYEELLEELKKNAISPPNWITWNTCHVGELIKIRGKGPLKHAVMLGTAVY